jgi:hypothetical protein
MWAYHEQENLLVIAMSLFDKICGARIGTNSFLIVGLTCIVFLFLPLIWHDEASTKQHIRSLGDSTLGSTVQKSTMLPVAHGCLIASTLPLIFDVLYDVATAILLKPKRQANDGGLESLEFRARLLFMMMNIMPSSVYLHMRLRGGTRVLPFYYAATNQLTVIVTVSCLLFLLNSRKTVPSIVLFLEQTTFSVACVLKMFNLLFPSRVRLMSIATALVVIAYVCFAIHMALWLISLRRRYQERSFNLDNVELVCLIYS